MHLVLLVRGRNLLFLTVISLLSLGSFFSAPCVSAQGATNDLGNGGRHTVHGRIYVTNGQRSQVSGLRIRLTSGSAGDISLFTDEAGTFTFRRLLGGSYTVLVEGGGVFEDVTQNVYIDDPGSSSIRGAIRMSSVPRVVSVQIYLRPAGGSNSGMLLGVINAKWSAVPKEAVEKLKHGMELQQEGKNAEADAEFRRAIEIAPNFAPAHTALGKLILQSGKPEAALEHLRAAIRYDDKDFDAHLNLGIALLNLKTYDRAEPEFVAAAFLDRTAVTPHYYLGLLFVMKNDLNVAQKAFETARELKGGKSLPNIHKYLGRIYKQKDMEKEAIQEFETYLKLSPKAADADKVKKDISDIKAKQIKNAFV